MTIAFATEYVIPERARDLGYGKEYYLKFRHLVLDPKEVREINGSNQFFVLLEEPEDISIESDFGIYDLFAKHINEQKYEHQGIITITNHSEERNYVKFIQVIPKNKTK